MHLLISMVSNELQGYLWFPNGELIFSVDRCCFSSVTCEPPAGRMGVSSSGDKANSTSLVNSAPLRLIFVAE